MRMLASRDCGVHSLAPIEAGHAGPGKAAFTFSEGEDQEQKGAGGLFCAKGAPGKVLTGRRLKIDAVSDTSFKLLNTKPVTASNLILFSASANYCVHYMNLFTWNLRYWIS